MPNKKDEKNKKESDNKDKDEKNDNLPINARES